MMQKGLLQIALRPLLLGYLVVLGLVGFYHWGHFAHGAAATLDATDRQLPAFDIEALDGSKKTNADLLEGLWVINFWASWCGPCVEELPSMNRAAAALADDNIRWIAINAGEGRDTVTEFLKKVPIDFDVWLGDAASTLPTFAVRALPTTLIVDSDGVVVQEALGPRDWDSDEMLEAIRALR